MQVMSAVLDPIAVGRSLVFVVSLAVLLVAHLVGDHVVQTDHQAAGKAGRGWPAAGAMAGHLATYHAFATVLLVTVFALLRLPLGLLAVIAGLAFSAVTHALLDRRWPVRRLLRATRAAKFAETNTPVCGMHAADQALHYLALLISAALIAAL
jgi:membrane-associated protease RseP (regulator of RpoE activity)